MAPGTPTLRLLARLLVAYLLASLAGAVALFGGGGGHADVPLTTWPGYLLLAPAVPLLLAGRLAPPLQPRDLAAAAAFVACFGLAWRWTGPRRRGRGRGA